LRKEFLKKAGQFFARQINTNPAPPKDAASAREAGKCFWLEHREK
jgi:hypothetical protein